MCRPRPKCAETVNNALQATPKTSAPITKKSEAVIFRDTVIEVKSRRAMMIAATAVILQMSPNISGARDVSGGRSTALEAAIAGISKTFSASEIRRNDNGRKGRIVQPTSICVEAKSWGA